MPPTVCILGLGLMGRPMDRVLRAAGWDVSGWNRSVLPPEEVNGIRIVSTLPEAARADICLLMLTDSLAVNTVLGQLEPGLHPGQIVIDMGTSNPADSKVHAARLAAREIGWVDAPVSGGPEGAAAGTLAIMAGGTTEDFTRVQSTLETLGGNVVHVGGPGMGHTVKVINQLIVGLAMQAVAEGLTLAELAGIDPSLVQQALKGGLADSKILQIHGSRMNSRSYIPGGRVATQLKDLQMAQELAAVADTKLPHLDSTIELYEKLMAQGDGDLDHSAVHKLLWT